MSSTERAICECWREWQKSPLRKATVPAHSEYLYATSLDSCVIVYSTRIHLSVHQLMTVYLADRWLISSLPSSLPGWLSAGLCLKVSEPSFSPLHSRSLISALNLHSICQFSRLFLYVCCSDLSPIYLFLFPSMPYLLPSIINSRLHQLTDTSVSSLLSSFIH